MTALLLSAVLLLSLCACSTAQDNAPGALGYTEEDFRILLQGNLDEIYLGKFNEKYLTLLGNTKEDRLPIYEAGLAQPADYFCYYFAIESPSDAYVAKVMELFKEIYSHAKYTVGEVSLLEENVYVGTVTISPVNIIELTVAAIENGALDHVYNKYTPKEIHSMSIEDYAAYQQLWADEVLKVAKDQLSDIGYGEEQTIMVQIVLENNAWCIRSTDLKAVDKLIVAYP